MDPMGVFRGGSVQGRGSSFLLSVLSVNSLLLSIFLSSLSSNLTPPMEDLGVASVVATVLYARGLTQRVLSCDKSVNIEGYPFIDVCQSVNDGSHF